VSLNDLPEQLGTCQGEQVEDTACIERSEKSQPEEAGRLPRLRVLRQVNCEGQERRDNNPTHRRESPCRHFLIDKEDISE